MVILLFSVPNITHQSIKFSMLFSEFNYQKTGILDDTHVKFYTVRTIIDLLNKFNFYIADMAIIRKDFLVMIIH